MKLALTHPTRLLVVGAVLALLLTLGSGLVKRPAIAGAEPAPYGAECTVDSLKRAMRNAMADHTDSESLIILAPGCTYNLTQVDNVDEFTGPNGLPIIVENPLRIKGFGSTIRRDPHRTTPLFRLFDVRGTLTLEDVTLFNGDAGPDGGGALEVTQGTVTLNRVMVNHNHAAFGGGLHFYGANLNGSATSRLPSTS